MSLVEYIAPEFYPPAASLFPVRFLLPALLLAACATTEVPPPTDASSSVLAVNVNISGTRMSGATAYPRKVLFARLAEGSDDPAQAEAVAWSNYARGPRAYLFNAAPGRYAVTCAVPLVDGKDHYVFLPENVIRASIIEVKPGAVVFMGVAAATETTIWSKADALQNHFHGGVQSARKKPSVLAQLFPSHIDYRGQYGRFQRDPDRAAQSEAQMKKTIRAWGWER
jgi:hypothetical protein